MEVSRPGVRRGRLCAQVVLADLNGAIGWVCGWLHPAGGPPGDCDAMEAVPPPFPVGEEASQRPREGA